MAIVTWMVESSDSFLDGIAETTFGSLIGAAGTLGAIMASLAVILVAVNALMQFRSVDAGQSIALMVKLAIISILALNWSQFNLITDAVESAINAIAGQIIGSVGGDPGVGALDFAGRFDDFLDYQTLISNTAIENMNWVGGGVWGVVSAFLLGITAALAGAVIVFAKIMLTVYIGIAPIMLLLLIFKVTSDYFQNWLSGLVSYMLYPLVMAAIFSIVFGLTEGIIERIGNVASVTSIGQLLPFVVMIFLTIFGVILVPMIVRQISGNISLATPMAGAAGAASVVMAAKTLGATRIAGMGLSAASGTARTAATSGAARAASAAGSAEAARLSRAMRVQG